MTKSIVASILLMTAASAVANEAKVAEKDVARAALEAVTKKYPTAKKVGFDKEVEHGNLTYEIKLVDGARHIDVDVSPNGRITAEEEVVAEKDVPKLARDALSMSKYGSWKVKRVERVVKNEKADAPLFEFVVGRDKDRADVLISNDGKIVSVEAAEPDSLR